jgi:hypothetical protein
MKDLLKRSRTVLIAYILLQAWRTRKRFASGKIDSPSGATTVHRPLETSLEYVNRVFADFVRYGNLTPDQIRGKRMLEFGPGDNVGVALRFLAWGAAEVICVDKYFAPHEAERERQLYLAIRDGLNAEEKRCFDDAVSLQAGIQFNPRRTRYIHGVGAEDADGAFNDSEFDFIISRGVLQGVDLERCVRVIHKLLAPGGISLHKSDLRDHGMFSGTGHHPLEFLTISESVYRKMTEGTDRPNRAHLDDYRRLLEQYKFDYQLYRVGVISRQYIPIPQDIVPHKLSLEHGVDYTDADLAMVREIRPRLHPRYHSLTDEDLLTSGLFIVCRKPAE